MISAIVDGVLLLALIVTTVKLVTMYRELKRLGAYHTDYQRVFDQTALALDGIEVSIQEINVRGSQVLNALGSRMDDARELIAEIDGLTREAKRQQSVLKAELKALSEAAARQTAPEHFASEDAADLYDNAPEHSKSASDPLGSANRFLTGAKRVTDKTISAGKRMAAKPPRIHRIDDGTNNPFRSISMNQKDDLS